MKILRFIVVTVVVSWLFAWTCLRNVAHASILHLRLRSNALEDVQISVSIWLICKCWPSGFYPTQRRISQRNTARSQKNYGPDLDACVVTISNYHAKIIFAIGA